MAVSWTTWELSHSTTWLAVMALLDIIPNVIILPWGGVLADRADRFRIAVVTAVLALLLASVLALLAGTGQLTIWRLAVLVTLQGILHGFSIPAVFGMLPRFVERKRLSAAIAVNSSYTQFAIFAGPALAGWLIHRYGTSAAFACNAAGYVIYLCSTAFLQTPTEYRPPVNTGKTVFGDLLDGARYITGHRGISALLMLMLVGDAMGNAVYQMLPAYADKILGMGVGGMSSLMTAAGLGATFSALWLAHGGAANVKPQRVLWAFLAYGAAIACLVLVHDMALAIASMMAFGMAGEIRRTGTVSLLQLSVSDAQRGRVMSSQFLLQRAAAGLGTYLVGAVAEQHGLRLPLLVAVGLSWIAWALAFRRRQIIFSAFQPPASTSEASAG
jgi:MFS family permease